MDKEQRADGEKDTQMGDKGIIMKYQSENDSFSHVASGDNMLGIAFCFPTSQLTYSKCE